MRLRAAVIVGFVLLATAATPDEPKENEHVSALLKSIAGKEDRPAGEVFKNVRLLKNVPAARFVRMMDLGYSRALGVDCDHCHVDDIWDTDDKRPKRAAREMIQMVNHINDSLGKMQEIDNMEPAVNCNTCHRGYVKPAQQMR